MNNLNKYLAQLADLEWSKVVIGGIAIAALYFFMLYDSGVTLVEEVKTMKVSLEEAQLQLKRTQQAMDDAKRFEERVKQQQAEFLTIVQFMPSELEHKDLIAIIGRQASLADVRVMNVDREPTAEKKEFYEMIRARITIKGSFAKVVTFLSYLSQVRRLLTFEKVELAAGAAAGTNNEANTDASGAGLLTFTGTLVGYRYVKPAEAPKPAAGAPAAPPVPGGGG